MRSTLGKPRAETSRCFWWGWYPHDTAGTRVLVMGLVPPRHGWYPCACDGAGTPTTRLVPVCWWGWYPHDTAGTRVLVELIPPRLVPVPVRCRCRSWAGPLPVLCGSGPCGAGLRGVPERMPCVPACCVWVYPYPCIRTYSLCCTGCVCVTAFAISMGMGLCYPALAVHREKVMPRKYPKLERKRANPARSRA